MSFCARGNHLDGGTHRSVKRRYRSLSGADRCLCPPTSRLESNTDDANALSKLFFAHTPGALAAPTAGLSLTPEILSEIPHTFVTLACRDWNFLAVRSENIADHRMHAERFSFRILLPTGS